MQPLPLKLAPGSDLRLSLEELAQRDGISGFVLGVVGNLTKASFQCPGQAEPTVLEGDLEVITLNGTFSPEGVHLHLSLSDGACQVWGGHLEPGTIVQKGVDLLIGVLEQREGRPARQTAAAAPRIEIAVLPGCPWCSRALRILRTDPPLRLLNGGFWCALLREAVEKVLVLSGLVGPLFQLENHAVGLQGHQGVELIFCNLDAVGGRIALRCNCC